jgi:hypothetical protein
MTTTEATMAADAAVLAICQLQVLIDEGTTDQKQIGREAMDLVCGQAHEPGTS